MERVFQSARNKSKYSEAQKRKKKRIRKLNNCMQLIYICFNVEIP